MWQDEMERVESTGSEGWRGAVMARLDALKIKGTREHVEWGWHHVDDVISSYEQPRNSLIRRWSGWVVLVRVLYSKARVRVVPIRKSPEGERAPAMKNILSSIQSLLVPMLNAFIYLLHFVGSVDSSICKAHLSLPMACSGSMRSSGSEASPGSSTHRRQRTDRRAEKVYKWIGFCDVELL